MKTEGKALAPEQKQRKVAQLAEELFAIELDLATLTLSSWHEGLSVEADPLIGPAALLGVRSVNEAHD